MELKELRRAVEGLTFRFAKTMPEDPHWYVVRSAENEAVYVALFEAVRTHGVWAPFRDYRQQYLHLGDGFKYWVMTADVHRSRVINRARVEGDSPVL